MKNIRFSAVLFGALTLWQAMLSRYVIGGASLTQVPLFLVFESFAVFAFGAVAIWLMAQPGEGFSCAAKRALVTGGVLYGAFVVMNGETEMMIAQYGLSTLSEAFGGMTFLIGALAVKALLLVAAIVFAVLPDKAAVAASAEVISPETLAQEVMAEADEAVVAESVRTSTEEA